MRPIRAARVSIPPPSLSNPVSDREDDPDDDEDSPELDDSEILADLSDDTDVHCSSPIYQQERVTADPIFLVWLLGGQEIDLVHSRLKSISALSLQRFGPTLKRLCLRQNHIKMLDPEVMKALVNLTELDMYDNKIKDVRETLDPLVNITYVAHLPV